MARPHLIFRYATLRLAETRLDATILLRFRLSGLSGSGWSSAQILELV